MPAHLEALRGLAHPSSLRPRRVRGQAESQRGLRGILRRRRLRVCVPWDINYKTRAVFGVCHISPAAMRRGNFPCDGQAESRAVRPASDEGLEDAFPVDGGN